MKYSTLALLFLLTLSLLTAQDAGQRSYLGEVHTPRGRLHMLMIFVRYEDKDLSVGNPKWKNHDSLPPLATEDQLLLADPERLHRGERIANLSDFYYTMSRGEFVVTGEAFPVQVPVPYVPESVNFFARQRRMNRAAVAWIARNYPDFDWSRFDRRANRPNYRLDNRETPPDSVLDYVLFLHRDLQGSTGMAATGGNFSLGNGYRVQDGYTSIKNAAEPDHHWTYFKHEFAHNLYGAPHYMGANKTDGTRFYTQKGWGMMSESGPIFFAANNWERWWLNWIEVETIDAPGRYRLDDALTEGGAMRIQIPGTRDYLWLENHQLQDPWDGRTFNEETEYPIQPQTRGLYTYVVGEPGADRESMLRPFTVAHNNLIKVLPADGAWDWVPTGDNIKLKYHSPQVWQRTGPNPISGQNDLQMIRYDKNGDGRIGIGYGHGNRDGGGHEQEAVWGERIDGVDMPTHNTDGDAGDAFVVGRELSLSDVPALNYPEYNKARDSLHAYRLNGVRVAVVAQNEDGSLELDVRFDDWEVRRDARWTGTILLPPPAGLDERYLDIAEGVTLQLDQSGTPNRSQTDPETGTFVRPTELTVASYRGIRLNRRSKLVIENGSRLRIRGYGQLVIPAGAKVVVREGGKLILEDGAQLRVERGGKLIIEEDGDLHRPSGALLDVARGGKVRVRQ